MTGTTTTESPLRYRLTDKIEGCEVRRGGEEQAK